MSRIRFKTALLLVCCGTLALPPSSARGDRDSAAGNPASVRAELDELRQRIERESKRLRQVNDERARISNDLEELKTEQRVTAERTAALQESIAELGENAEQLKLLVFGAKLQMEQQRARLHKRLVAMYKAKRRAPHADYLFQAGSATDLLKRAHYLSSIAEYDKGYINRLLRLVKRGQTDRERLDGLLRRRRDALRALKEAEARLEVQKVKKASLLRDRDAKVKQQEASLKKLQSSADRLEKVLARLMGESPTPLTEPVEPGVPKFTGRGLGGMRGKLEFPVGGTLVQRFGKQQHKEFSDMLFKKGLEVLAPAGEQVRAVAPGRVLFQQPLPGYGKVVILDHGRRYYTLYGRLGRPLVEVGDVVGEGEAVAELGSPDREGRNFYFELRIQGKATNPAGYFANPPRKSKS